MSTNGSLATGNLFCQKSPTARATGKLKVATRTAGFATMFDTTLTEGAGVENVALSTSGVTVIATPSVTVGAGRLKVALKTLEATEALLSAVTVAEGRLKVATSTAGTTFESGVITFDVGSENVATRGLGDTDEFPVIAGAGREKVQANTAGVEDTFRTAVTVDAGSENVQARTEGVVLTSVVPPASFPVA